MPKHHKFIFENNVYNLQELSKVLNIPVYTLGRIVRSNNCKTVEDILSCTGDDLKHPSRLIHVGDKINHWIILDANPIMLDKHLKYKVQCDCGSEPVMRSLSEIRRTNRCRKCSHGPNMLDIHIGDVYNNWTVIDGPFKKNNALYYKVSCKCGAERLKQPGELVHGAKMCPKCARELLIPKIVKKNGAIGDLRISKLWKINNSAKARNLECSLTMEYLWDLYLKQNKKCAITGDYLPNINKASLDRIDSSKGYIEGNVQWVTSIANICKYTLTMEELIDFCKKVINHANQQPS